MKSAARSVLNELKAIKPADPADLKPMLQGTLAKIDELSSEDQWAVAEEMEGALLGDTFVTKQDVKALEKKMQQVDAETGIVQDFGKMEDQIKGAMLVFEKIATIKGPAATMFTQNVVSRYAELQENQQDDLLSMMRLLSKARSPQNDFVKETKAQAAQAQRAAKDYFDPLAKAYKRAAERKSSLDPNAGQKHAGPKSWWKKPF